MEFKASKEYVMDAIDKQKNCTVFTVINLVIFLFAFLYCRNGNYPFTFLVIAIVTLTSAWRGYKNGKRYGNQITDVNDSFINLEEGYFNCSQAAENYTYEECEIKLSEIEVITEDTQVGRCGFFIQTSLDSKDSNIYVDNNNVKRNIFYVNGINYKRVDFKKLYQTLRNKVPEYVEVKGTLDQTSWNIPTEKMEFLKNISLVIFIYIVAIIHFFIYLANR